VGKREARLRRLEPSELGSKHLEASLDQPLRLGQRDLRLVHVLEAVWHHVVAAALELIPEAEVAFPPPAVPLVVGLPAMAGSDHVQLGDQAVVFENLRGPNR
jgi:hypothetical protein